MSASNSDNPGARSRVVMTLGKTLVFKGEMSASEDIVLMGRLEGSLTEGESVTVAVGGVVVGDLRARQITIKGAVLGDIEASESIVIDSTAEMTGDLAAPRVSIIEGARFNGKVEMDDEQTDTQKVRVSPFNAADGTGEQPINPTTVDRMLRNR